MANLCVSPKGAQSKTGVVMTCGSLPSCVRRWASFSVKVRLSGCLLGPVEVRFLMVSASDWLSLVGGKISGSFCACEVKLEPNRCLEGSAAVLETGVKVSLWASQRFLSSLGRDV